MFGCCLAARVDIDAHSDQVDACQTLAEQADCLARADDQVVGPLQQHVFGVFAAEVDQGITRGEGTGRLKQTVRGERSIAIKEDP